MSHAKTMRSNVTRAVTLRSFSGYAVKNCPDTVWIGETGAGNVCVARAAALIGRQMAGLAVKTHRMRRARIVSNKINGLLDVASAHRTASRRNMSDINGLLAHSTDCKSVGAPPRGASIRPVAAGGCPPKSPALKNRGVPPHRFTLQAHGWTYNEGREILLGGAGVGGRVL